VGRSLDDYHVDVGRLRRWKRCRDEDRISRLVPWCQAAPGSRRAATVRPARTSTLIARSMGTRYAPFLLVEASLTTSVGVPETVKAVAAHTTALGISWPAVSWTTPATIPRDRGALLGRGLETPRSSRQPRL